MSFRFSVCFLSSGLKSNNPIEYLRSELKLKFCLGHYSIRFFWCFLPEWLILAISGRTKKERYLLKISRQALHSFMKPNSLRTGYTFDDVLLVPKSSSIRSRRTVSVASRLSKRIELKTPIIAANMDTVCEDEMAIAMARLGAIGIIHRFMPHKIQADQVKKVKQASADYLVGAAVGTDKDLNERSQALVDAGVDVLVLDIAHGHSAHSIDGVKALKRNFPKVDVIAGNVATAKGAADLAKAGADAIKVGVGPGGVCTTRLVAGVGVPQMTAIWDAASAVEVPIIADGGIKTSGDIAKALAAGASSVMIGSLLAGTKESPGKIEVGPAGLQKRLRGMASFEAATARAGRHGEEDLDIDDEYREQRAPEGVEGAVPYRGQVHLLIGELMAGVRSAMSYCDARDLKELRKNAEFIAVTANGSRENGPHAVQVETKT